MSDPLSRPKFSPESVEVPPTVTLVRMAHRAVAEALSGEKPLHLSPDFVLAWLSRHGYVVEVLNNDGSLAYELTARGKQAMTLAQP